MILSHDAEPLQAALSLCNLVLLFVISWPLLSLQINLGPVHFLFSSTIRRRNSHHLSWRFLSSFSLSQILFRMLDLSFLPKFSAEKETKADFRHMERKPSFTASFQGRRSSRIALQSLERSRTVVPSLPLEAKNARSEAQIPDNKMHGYGRDEVESDDLSSIYANCEASVEYSGRERLKRLRVEMSGRVLIPDVWGQEELLMDWIDSAAFDASLFPGEIGSARAALVEEGRKANSGRLRIENRC